MLSKTIFKQTVKANWVIWAIFTVIMCAFSALIIATYNPATVASITSALEGTAIAEMAGDQISTMTTLLGSLSSSYYGGMAILLPLIFIIITANSLVASEVDRGSMAYTLSTPIKRNSVIFTKGITLIASLILMFSFVTATGVITTQISHHAVWGTNYTQDVKAVAKNLDMKKSDVANDLSIMLSDGNLLKIGAEARGIDEDVYTIYLSLALQRNEGTVIEPTPEEIEMQEQIQDQMIKGLKAAAIVLDMKLSDLSADMGILKENEEALTAAGIASGFTNEMFIGIINQALAANEISKDVPVEFDMSNFIMMNVGCLLLLFAISGISFLASCAANRTKHSIMFGAGIPIMFFLFHILTQTGASLKNFKYFTLMSLFDNLGIAAGNISGIMLGTLGLLGIALYIFAIKIFTKKDLPL